MKVRLDVDQMRLKGFESEEVMAKTDIDCMVEHLVFLRDDYLAPGVCSCHVVSEAEEVFEVFESVLTGKVAEDEEGKGLHNYYTIRGGPPK